MPKRRRSDFRRRFGRADRCKNTSRTERCATCMRSSAISLSPIRGAHHRRLVFLRSVQAAMRSEGRVRQGRRAHRGCGCFGRFPPVGRARTPWVFQTLSAWRRGHGPQTFQALFARRRACASRALFGRRFCRRIAAWTRFRVAFCLCSEHSGNHGRGAGAAGLDFQEFPARAALHDLLNGVQNMIGHFLGGAVGAAL